MKVEKTRLENIYIITPQSFHDNRGWFYESYSKPKLKEFGIDIEFIQDNHSFSKHINTIRGIFSELPLHKATCRCIAGRI